MAKDRFKVCPICKQKFFESECWNSYIFEKKHLCGGYFCCKEWYKRFERLRNMGVKIIKSNLRTDKNFDFNYDYLLVNGVQNVFFREGELLALPQFLGEIINVDGMSILFCKDEELMKKASDLKKTFGILTEVIRSG